MSLVWENLGQEYNKNQKLIIPINVIPNFKNDSVYIEMFYQLESDSDTYLFGDY
ncbi:MULTISPECIES: hypothetical protein [Flavobacterium]|uniref:hypothetical protein n=1 Tax=Flavobacterium TaxID=237 RepID=UPI0015DFD840|nr:MULTISPECIES: hypothetical protein [Flavobacterium]